MSGWNIKRVLIVFSISNQLSFTMSKRRHSGEGNFGGKVGEYYVWSRRVGKRRFVVKRKDYTEFRKQVAKKQREIEQLGLNCQSKDVTLSQFVPGWLEGFVKPPKRSLGTYRSYHGTWKNQIAPRLGTTKLSRLMTATIQIWINDLERSSIGVRTIHVAFVVLKRALDSAVTQGYIVRNPCIGCELPRSRPQTPRLLSPDQMDELLKAAFKRPHVHRTDALFRREACRYRHLFRFKLACGLRISELLGLLRIRCDLERGVVQVSEQLEWDGSKWSLVPPKTRSSIRTIVLEPEAVKILKQQIAMVNRERRQIPDYEDNGLVFPTLRGTPAHPRNVQRQLDTCLELAELEHVGLHDLRRTCLTNLANRGLAMHQLKAYAGHTSITTTAKYYVAVSLEAQKAALDALKPLKDTVHMLRRPGSREQYLNSTRSSSRISKTVRLAI